MLKIIQLVKYISEVNPQLTPARLSFYNYLRAISQTQEQLTATVINDYIYSAIHFPHWASNRNMLGDEIKCILENFNRIFQNKISLEDIHFPQSIQVIELEHNSDFEGAVRYHIEKITGARDKYKLVNEQSKKINALILREDNSFEVKIFDRKFTIRNGQLEPLRINQGLFYNAELELAPGKLQLIDIAPYISAQFTYSNSQVTGTVLRGYVYQEMQKLLNSKLEEQTKIYYAMKHIEQYFIDRRTDQYYSQLINRLERTNSLVSDGDMVAAKSAHIVLNQAELAIENIYHDDKLLTLLVKDLKNNLKQFPKAPEVCLTPNQSIKHDLIN